MLVSPFSKEIAFSVVGAGDISDFALKPEEEAIIKGVTSDATRRNFTLGRAAAREALCSLGFKNQTPLIRNNTGAPIWPKGYIGSISHKDGLGIAAVAKSDTIKMIGIDIECIKGAAPKIRDKIAHENEFGFLDAFGDAGLLMLFSAKEALYKALAPAHGKFIRFKDVWLEWSEAERLFIAHPLSEEIKYLFTSQIRIRSERFNDLILASVVVYN